MTANCTGEYWEKKRKVTALREQRQASLENAFTRFFEAQETRCEELRELKQTATKCRDASLRERQYPLADKYTLFLRQTKRRTTKKPELQIALVTKSSIQQESDYCKQVQLAAAAADEKIKLISERQTARRNELNAAAPSFLEQLESNRSRQSSPVAVPSKLDQFLAGNLPSPLPDQSQAPSQTEEPTTPTTPSPAEVRAQTAKPSLLTRVSSVLGSLFWK
jgi:hypothetical protein